MSRSRTIDRDFIALSSIFVFFEFFWLVIRENADFIPNQVRIGRQGFNHQF